MFSHKQGIHSYIAIASVKYASVDKIYDVEELVACALGKVFQVGIRRKTKVEKLLWQSIGKEILHAYEFKI